MTARDWLKRALVGALGGLLLGWLLPGLLGPPISSYALTLRDDPRLSDAVLGAGSFGVYIAEAPSVYAGQHTTSPTVHQGLLNAASWALIGLVIAAFVMAVRGARTSGTLGSRLLAGALGGLLIGWMVPAVASALAGCFAHCYMHEGVLGDLALAGGVALRVVGWNAEMPWRLFFESAPNPTPPPVAMLVSAIMWAAAGVALVALLSAALHGFARSHTATNAPDAEADRT